MSEIKLITFDLDNTLWNVETVIHRAEQRMRDWLHVRVPDYQPRFPVEAMMALRNSVLEELPHLKHDLSTLREEMIFRAILDCGFSRADARRMAREAFDIFLDARHEVEFFDGALETLEQLSERYVLGALTNGNADISRLSINRFFQFGYSSASVGIGKPAPQMFHAALDFAGIAPAQAIHIGDHLLDDIEGASRVGMHTIWVNLNDTTAEREPAPDAETQNHQVTLLSDIPASVLNIAQRLGSL